jgi:hypothetical protein
VVIDGIAKVIKAGADVYEGLIVGMVVVVAVAFNQLRLGGGERKRFFTGALGAVTVVNLALLAGVLAAILGGRSVGGSAALITLLALSGVKLFDRKP